MSTLLPILLIVLMHVTLGHFILLETLEPFAKTRKPLEKALMVFFAPTVILYMVFEIIDYGFDFFKNEGFCDFTFWLTKQ